MGTSRQVIRAHRTEASAITRAHGAWVSSSVETAPPLLALAIIDEEEAAV